MGFGRIMYFGGDQHDPKHNEAHVFDAARLFDCSSNAVTYIASPHFDAFCSGHAFLGASNVVKLLVAGGTEQFPDHAEGIHHGHFPGLRDAAVFSSPDFIMPGGGWSWTRAADMTPGIVAPPALVRNPDPRLTGGRWYPTLTTLANGDVIAFSGHPGSSDASNSDIALRQFAHNNCIPEIFRREPLPYGKWRRLASHSNTADRDYYEKYFMPYYPRTHLLPTGDILCTNPVHESTISFNPDTGPHGGTFNELCPPPSTPAFSGFYGTSVLLPLRYSEEFKGLPRHYDGQISNALAMICGSFTDTPYVLLHRPVIFGAGVWNWHPTGPRRMREHRVHACSVILPTGEIFVTGGINAMDTPADPSLDTKGGRMPEMYNPYSDTWEVTGEAATSVRNYHSVALLMPDGRVWTAGSDVDKKLGAGKPPIGNDE